ncbi:hypothetical protein AAFF_G00170130 [Aldrovandia affinis]|uniref:Mucin-1 n=1 Tax=Aldrovandia affinis TaxID=143900 RepID=A0AAD7RLM2_9TELE|nr:hypothetical protein AAFF_G00170130 [Aldrovandia affinis]
MKITNKIYNDSLKDQNSEDYKTLNGEVTQVLNNVYGKYSYYKGVTEMIFSNGSVIADSTVVFQSRGINIKVVTHLLRNSIGPNGEAGDLTLDRDVHGGNVTGHPTADTKVPSSGGSTRKSLETKHVNSTTAAAAGGGGGVPGWGIAILVLVSLILLLLIIILILMLMRWCCGMEETGALNVSEDPNLTNKSNPKADFPAQAPPPIDPSSQQPYDTLYDDSTEKPKKNKTGMYVVNP